MDYPWIWTFVFLVAAFLFAVLEIFVPSGGALAFMAVVTLLGSVAFAFLSGPLLGSLYFFCVTIGVPVFLWYALKWWPNTSLGRRILLQPEDDPALRPNTELERLKTLVGKRGTAKSQMMLSGLVEIEGRRINAVSESTIVEIGDEVVVIAVDGINVLVRPVPKAVDKSLILSASPTNEPTIEDPFA